MTISMYQAAVPVFTRMLNNLAGVVRKGAAYAAAKKVDEAVLLNARLFPDMFALKRQIQIACDHARGGAARLAGAEPPSYEDNEQTFAELLARIDRSIEYLRTLKPQQIDGSEERVITRQVGGKPRTFTGINYLLQFALPNFYFHATTAYAILRHNGVELGKADFVGALD